uniref:Serpin domain-containing protein n=1 Tax=Panagrolaimus superbus TaxID=310955 RepID=A0A914XSE0_9BILA
MSESVTIAQANFALNLIQEIGLNKSAVISPISISFALGMILLGANGNTAREIENAIAKGIIGDELHNHLLNVYNFINDNKNTVKMGNKVYFADNLQIFEYYKKQLQKFYNGNFQLTDFTDTQKAANVHI